MEVRAKSNIAEVRKGRIAGEEHKGSFNESQQRSESRDEKVKVRIM